MWNGLIHSGATLLLLSVDHYNFGWCCIYFPGGKFESIDRICDCTSITSLICYKTPISKTRLST